MTINTEFGFVLSDCFYKIFTKLLRAINLMNCRATLNLNTKLAISHVAFIFLETFQFIQKPPRIVRVVEGTRKSLIWDFTATASKYYVIISRQRPGETVTEQIATRRESTWFTIKGSYSANYIAWLPATLQLINVQRSENYVYTLSIFDEFAVQRLSDSVTVEVVGKYKLAVFL